MIGVGGFLATVFFTAIRDLSIWLLSYGLLPLVLLLWVAVGGLTLYVIAKWLTPQGA